MKFFPQFSYRGNLIKNEKIGPVWRKHIQVGFRFNLWLILPHGIVLCVKSLSLSKNNPSYYEENYGAIFNKINSTLIKNDLYRVMSKLWSFNQTSFLKTLFDNLNLSWIYSTVPGEKLCINNTTKRELTRQAIF